MNCVHPVSSPGVSSSLLTQWASARAGIISTDVQTATQDPNAPLAPVWTPGISPSAEALVQRALTNKSFFDTNAKLYSDLGASGDYKKLFALYSGRTAQEIAGIDAPEKLGRLHLSEHLTPQRSNGLMAMVKRIRADAEAALSKATLH